MYLLQTEQVERNYIKEKKAAVKEFDDKKVELKENLIAELEEKKKMIENEKLTMELTGGKGARTGLLIRDLLSKREMGEKKSMWVAVFYFFLHILILSHQMKSEFTDTVKMLTSIHLCIWSSHSYFFYS